MLMASRSSVIYLWVFHQKGEVAVVWLRTFRASVSLWQAVPDAVLLKVLSLS